MWQWNIHFPGLAGDEADLDTLFRKQQHGIGAKRRQMAHASNSIPRTCGRGYGSDATCGVVFFSSKM